jgi:uncharacterized YccA/Bax inhibitor family protein
MINGGDIALIIGALGTFVTSLVTAFVTLRNSRSVAVLQAKVEQVHDTTNSLAERAERLAKESGLAQGNLQGRAEQTAERKEATKE